MMRWWIAMVCLITTPSGAAEFRLTSPVVKEQGTVANEQVFNSFGCSGKNISPELHWDNGPSETKSFAITVYDPERADRKRMVALGRLQHSSQRPYAACQCRQAGQCHC